MEESLTDYKNAVKHMKQNFWQIKMTVEQIICTIIKQEEKEGEKKCEKNLKQWLDCFDI